MRRLLGTDLWRSVLGATSAVDDLDWARGITAALPVGVDAVGFECRLGAKRSADFGVMISRPTVAASGDISPPLRDWIAHWSRPESLLARMVPLIFLEFDHPTRNARNIPSLFFRLAVPPSPRFGVSPRRALDSAARTAVEGLAILGVPSRTTVGLRRLIETLPPGAIPLQVGAMLARQREVRMLVMVPVAVASNFLARIDSCARGSTTALQARYAPAEDWCAIHLEFVGSTPVVVGIEFPFSPLTGLPRADAFAALLAVLVADGLCTPDHREALATWSGDRVCDEDGVRHIQERSISHVKVGIDAAGQAIAKAYYCVSALALTGEIDNDHPGLGSTTT